MGRMGLVGTEEITNILAYKFVTPKMFVRARMFVDINDLYLLNRSYVNDASLVATITPSQASCSVYNIWQV